MDQNKIINGWDFYNLGLDALATAISLTRFSHITLEESNISNNILEAIVNNRNIKSMRVYHISYDYEMEILLERILESRSDIKIEVCYDPHRDYRYYTAGDINGIDTEKIFQTFPTNITDVTKSWLLSQHSTKNGYENLYEEYIAYKNMYNCSEDDSDNSYSSE
ncbi:Hypothetical protein HVR_LOCUS916 [uncultured virus]|nr:Hypothetical protein HVR_LOCUS916 [uncultured virus]